jgi:phosphomannomutase
MHQKLINLNMCLHTIEQANAHGDAIITSVQARLDLKDAINKLEAETKHIMITTGKSFLNTKMEEQHSSSTPEIVIEV